MQKKYLLNILTLAILIGQLVIFAHNFEFDSDHNDHHIEFNHDCEVCLYSAKLNHDGDFNYDLSKPVGMQRKLVDSSKCQHWGWHPKHTLQQGVQLTYDYYLKEVFDE